jgi:hypothetical protein
MVKLKRKINLTKCPNNKQKERGPNWKNIYSKMGWNDETENK